MKGHHLESAAHVRGDSQYVDDLPEPRGMLHGTVLFSQKAHADLKAVDLEPVRQAPGVVAVITASDIPGENTLGPVIRDETLFATESVHYIGQPIALVVAESPEAGRAARELVKIDYTEKEAITNPRVAYERGQIIADPRTFAMGDTATGFDACDVIVEGECDIRGQEHLYLETNRARAELQDGGRIVVSASTQSPYASQKSVARVLGIPEHRVEIDVRRLGGGFGGKEDQATHFAVMAALAALRLKRPVQIVLNREDDLQITGKRHPYLADFRLGLKKDGELVAFEAMLYQNSGAFADLSPPVLARSLFHATGAYFVPNVRVTGACCRTNIHPHTAFRGFGGPQGMFIIEAAIAKAAETLGMSREALQRKNLIRESQSFSYGQLSEEDKAMSTWELLDKKIDLEATRERVNAFNASHPLTKKGLAVMPVCFGISFTKSFLNQASALVHLYTDGSVSISTGGIEMGQGVSSNVARLASHVFGISIERIRVESTNTTRIANMSPSAASATTDLN
ncbi:MAG: molybdopterin cofactor-binding domain-containing protein, partial [Myxococcota bacterium]